MAAAAIGIAALIALGVLLASRTWTHAPGMMSTGQRAASTWTQQHPQMWAWMGTHWDEMTQMHQHWGDTAWMREHLADYPWMQQHWGSMSWMAQHWSAMSWRHSQGMMGSSSGGMMGG